MAVSKYNRILLKLSGQSFCKPGEFGIDGSALESIAERISQICKIGPQVAVVVGAGNFLRGETFSQASHIPRNTADYMGMLATIINACALQETLEFPQCVSVLFAEGPFGTLSDGELRYWQAEPEILFLLPTPVLR
jgi:uridylate kinase